MSNVENINQLTREYRKLKQDGFTGYYQYQEIKKIGQNLFEEGGNKKMHDVSMLVSEDAEGLLNSAWDGIGHWVA